MTRTAAEAVREALELGLCQAEEGEDQMAFAIALDSHEAREEMLAKLVHRWRRTAEEGENDARVAYRACSMALQRVLELPAVLPKEDGEEEDEPMEVVGWA